MKNLVLDLNIIESGICHAVWGDCQNIAEAYDKHFCDIVKHNAVVHLIEHGRCRENYIMEDDWNKITDALGSITRESAWRDVYDIVDKIVPADYDVYEIIKAEASKGGTTAAREGEDMEFRLVEYIGTNGVYTVLDESDSANDELCDRCDAIALPAAILKHIRGEFRAIHGNAAYQDILREEQRKRLAEIDERLAEINEERERLMEHRELLQRVINR